MSRLMRGLAALLLTLGLSGAPAWAQTPDKSVFILLDTSGSMSGNGMTMAQAALGTLLDEMQEDGEYRLALIKGTGRNVEVPMGTNNVAAIRQRIGFGGSGGNPTTDLETFASQVLPQVPGCHIVLLVTDGDDGSNPVAAAGNIKSRCSRLFVVGVGLGQGSEAVLSPIAGTGGGRFCNGRDSAGLTYCVLSVFKPYQYREDLGHCANSDGFPGINPMPRVDRLSRLRDWECYDFSGQDFTLSGLQGRGIRAFGAGGLGKSIRGSDFTGANLEGQGISQPYSGARMRQARLAKSTLSGRADHVDFSGADLREATLGGGKERCFRNWELSAAKLDGARFYDLKVCGIRLSGTLSVPQFYTVEWRGLRLGSGLVLDGARGKGLKLVDVAGAVLEFRGGDLGDVELETLRLETLALREVGRSANPGAFSGRDLKATAGMVVERAAFSSLQLRSLSTPSLGLDTIRGPVTVSHGELVETKLLTTDVEFVETKLERLQAQDFRKLGFRQLSRCGACVLRPADRARLAVEASTLVGLDVELNGMAPELLLEARKADLSGSRWKSVRWSANSSLQDVELQRASFEATPLSLVMVGVRLNDSRFTNSPLVMLEGSGSVDCLRCGPVLVDFKTDRVKRLRLTGSDSRLLIGMGGVELLELDVSQGRLRPVSSFQGLSCRDCKFDEAEVEGGFDGLVLLKPSAIKARFKGFSYLDRQGVEIRGGSFRGAVIEGQQEIKGSFDQVDFSDATFKDVALRGQVAGSQFLRTQFLAGLQEAEVRNSDFSQAVFPSLSAALRHSTFSRVNFSGAKFPQGYQHSEKSEFERCWFDGQYGPATLKNLLMGAKGIKVSHANWAGVDLSGLNLSDVELVSVNLRGASLRGGSLSGTLDDVNLEGADLTAASLSGQVSNSSLHGARVADATLSGHFSGVALSNLREADQLTHFTAHLEDVNLSGSDLHNTHIRESNHMPNYQRLTLTDATISCDMLEVIREQATVTYGPYRARNWDLQSSQECTGGTP